MTLLKILPKFKYVSFYKSKCSAVIRKLRL